MGFISNCLGTTTYRGHRLPNGGDVHALILASEQLIQMANKLTFLNSAKSTAGFTLTDLLICLAILSILVTLAIPLHLEAVERAKAVEATEVLSEVVRLEHLRFVEKGNYTSDLQALGFQLTSALKYTE